MDNYRIFETEEFLKSLKKIHSSDSAFIIKKLKNYVYEILKSRPIFGRDIKKLQNYTPETWRYQIRNYRVFYHVDEESKIVFMLSVDIRGKAYKNKRLTHV